MSARWDIAGATIEDLDRVAAFLALALRPGDVVALSGELGTGKTTFARALIRRLTDDPELEIPSPTFALAQGYDQGRIPVIHIDCYRLDAPGEIAELGLDEALTSGAAVIEWPERAPGALPPDRLRVHMADEGAADTRRLTLSGEGTWGARLERLKAMATFCARAGWGGAAPAFLQGDASTRAYARIAERDRRAVLMDSPARPDGPPVRGGRPYSAIAHLAEDVRPFVAVAGALREAGLSAPEVYVQDLENGFLLIEDLGDRVYGAELASGGDQETLYMAAVDALVALSGHPPPESLPLPGGGEHILPAFDRGALQIEAELVVDWLWPALKGEAAPDTVRAAFLDAWAPLFDQLETADRGWVLRDYHSPNLMWLPGREGIARVGVLDFQDAMRGPLAYDLVSLAQDARTDVAPSLEARLLGHYCAAVSGRQQAFDRDRFGTAYAILGAQRNTKILGIFARLAARDGKRAYLAHMPRVSGYLERNLAHPGLGAVAAWYAEHLPAAERARAAAL